MSGIIANIPPMDPLKKSIGLGSLTKEYFSAPTIKSGPRAETLQ